MAKIDAFFKVMIEAGASDLHMSPGNLQQAIEQVKIALDLLPELHEACILLGLLHAENNNLELAIAHYKDTLNHGIQLPEIFNYLGVFLQEKEESDQALASYRQALQLKPDYPEVLNNLGVLLQRHYKQYGEAVTSYQQAVLLDPYYAIAHNNLASALAKQGQLQKARNHYLKALELEPHSPWIHSQLLFYTKAMPHETHLSLFKGYQAFGERYATPLQKQPADFHKHPGASLRVGYISPDLTAHSSTRLIEPLFFHHDRQKVQIYVYSDVLRPDEVTKKLQNLATSWKTVTGLTDEEVTEEIRQDQIDILVDLAGQTGNNRLLVFARKPAPIQVTGMGFGMTTGLSMIDYFITDPFLTPPHLAQYSTEKAVYLSRQFHWMPPSFILPLIDPPVLHRGYITFGSGNDLFKINSEVVVTWSKLLHRLPHSKLHIKTPPFRDKATQQLYFNLFKEQGISQERLIFSGETAIQNHIAFYNQIDIALDPYRYAGGVTTCEALWMGVPVLTMENSDRISLSILSALNLNSLIAPSEDAYIQRAVSLSQDRTQLKQWRKSLRQRLLDSVICDGKRYALEMESAYQRMWKHWLKHQV